MLRIRLRRVGKKKQPMYRIVVADSHKPRDGAFVENLGYYHPMDNPSTIVLDEERAKHWLEKGAMPSDRVAKILKIQGLAEIPAKLATRIALGEERAKEAKASKAKATEETAAEEPAAEEAVAEAATEKPKVEAATEEPAAKEAVAKEATSEAPKVEAAPAEEATPDNKEKSE